MRRTVRSDRKAALTGPAATVRHVLDVDALTPQEVRTILRRSTELKQARSRPQPLRGRFIALMFEKPSLRTRLSFEAAVAQLGGATTYLNASDVGLGTRESLADFGRVTGLYVDAVVLRVYQHSLLEELARYLPVPLINGLSDAAHPCQALGDALTITELFGARARPTVVFVGDGNNVARSLAIVCRYLGWRFRLCAPKRYQFDAAFVQRVEALPGSGAVEISKDPAEAVRDADVVYTDVWTSMGQERETRERRQAFRSFQVNRELLAHAPQHCRVMHCLPAHRGEEITDDVLDGPQSVVLQQAENRLHAQKGLLTWLFTTAAKTRKRSTNRRKRATE